MQSQMNAGLQMVNRRTRASPLHLYVSDVFTRHGKATDDDFPFRCSTMVGTLDHSLRVPVLLVLWEMLAYPRLTLIHDRRHPAECTM